MAAAPGTGGTLDRRDVLALVAAALVARVAFLAALPARAVSVDLSMSWVTVVEALERHENPYHTTALLNWPPLWMQLLFVLSRVAHALSISFAHAVQGFLTLVDLGAVALAAALARELGIARRTALVAIGLGVALDPMSILVSCQHGNFDPLVGALAAAVLLALVRYARTGDVVAWLGACALLGVAVLAKTVPIVLVPLVVNAAAARAPRPSGAARVLGAFLVLAPVTLAMSIVYALGPDEITHNVLAYRSMARAFGVTGLFAMAHGDALVPLYSAAFTKLALVGLGALTYALARRPIAQPRALVLAGGLLLLAPPTLGPGFGVQYLAWSIPALAVAASAFEGRWRRAVLVAFGVGAVTYVVQYGLVPSLGEAWLRLPGHPPAPWLVHLSETCSTEAGETTTRLPLFAAMLAVLGGGVVACRRAASDARAARAEGSSALAA